MHGITPTAPHVYLHDVRRAAAQLAFRRIICTIIFSPYTTWEAGGPFVNYLPAAVNLNEVESWSGGLFAGVVQLGDASSLIVLQFGNVLVEIQRVGVGEGSSLRHLPSGNHLLHSHLHLLAADGVLQGGEMKT